MQYRLNCETYQFEKTFVTVYGISYGDKHIYDISVSKYAVEALVLKCNRYHLNPIHLKDVIYDFLSDPGVSEKGRLLRGEFSKTVKKKAKDSSKTISSIASLFNLF